jgi:hypothetical protein
MRDLTKDRYLPNRLKSKPMIAFRAEPDVAFYVKDLNKSEVCNRGIRVLINVINNPENLLKELKMRHPELYKHVGRKRYELQKLKGGTNGTNKNRQDNCQG